MDFLQKWHEALLAAQTEVEFFVIIGQLQSRFEKNGLWLKYQKSGPLSAPSIAAIIEQRLCDSSQGRHDWDIKTTHVFTLTHAGTLQWQIMGRETIHGLVNIQAKLRDGLDFQLTDHLAATH